VPFHFAENESATPGGVRYRTCVFPPHFETPPHEHDGAFLCLVLDGVSEQRSGGEQRRRDRGRAYFYPPGERQSERFGATGGRILTVDHLPSDVRLPRRSSELAGRTALLARRLVSHDELSIDETAMAIVAALARESCDSVRWMPFVRDYLHAHFTRRLTLREIAAAANVHPVHLSRAFPQRFGTTLGEYVRALRVDYAARELTATSRPIADIALDAGFASQAHLTLHFRAHMNVTPAAFRASR
jgi:AraC family transcriptional regulator